MPKLVIGRPVLLVTTDASGLRHPVILRHQATAKQFDESETTAYWNRYEKKRNPVGKQRADNGCEGHGSKKKISLIPPFFMVSAYSDFYQLDWFKVGTNVQTSLTE